MQINFNQFPNYKHGVEEFANMELQKLEKYSTKIEKADIYYSESTTPEKEYRVEIKLAVPGPDLFAQKEAESFKKAFVLCVEKLDAQLNRQKQQQRKHATNKI